MNHETMVMRTELKPVASRRHFLEFLGIVALVTLSGFSGADT